MTRKHFNLIAAALADRYKRIPSSNIEQLALMHDIASDMASALSSTNPNFNRQRFLDACLPDREVA